MVVAEQQSSPEDWHIAIWSGSCPDVKGEDYDHGILSAIVLDRVYVYASV
jgi:hypothetical protein